MLNGFGFDGFVETGSFLGETCLLVLQQTDLPVWSCEVHEDHAAMAKRALREFASRVTLTREDSRPFLEAVFRAHPGRRFLFYLDAHWWEDIPLRDELRLILNQARSFVIVIDDFRVPHDPGFGFDTYGECALEMEWIAPALEGHRVDVWYPSYAARSETGFRRGMVILSSADLSEQIAREIPGTLLMRV
jgi:hypothetical protein